MPHLNATLRDYLPKVLRNYGDLVGSELRGFISTPITNTGKRPVKFEDLASVD